MAILMKQVCERKLDSTKCESQERLHSQLLHRKKKTWRNPELSPFESARMQHLYDEFQSDVRNKLTSILTLAYTVLSLSSDQYVAHMTVIGWHDIDSHVSKQTCKLNLKMIHWCLAASEMGGLNMTASDLGRCSEQAT